MLKGTQNAKVRDCSTLVETASCCVSSIHWTPCLLISDPSPSPCLRHLHCQLHLQQRLCYCYLAHEGWDHPMEGGAFVAKALLTSAQGSEVL